MQRSISIMKKIVNTLLFIEIYFVATGNQSLGACFIPVNKSKDKSGSKKNLSIKKLSEIGNYF